MITIRRPCGSSDLCGEAIDMKRIRDVLVAVALGAVAVTLAYLLVPWGLHLLMR
jgi:hypothetical protein